MSDELRIDREAVLSSAPKFDQAARELRDAADQLAGALAGLGSFWGDDAQGGQFAAGYQPHAETVQRAAANIATGLSSILPALQATTDGYDRTDAAAARRTTPGPR